jgi:hypothetical protein
MSDYEEFFQKIDTALEKAPESRHSFYQLKYFVIGKEPTIQSKLWQALRELQSRKETIESIGLQIEDLKDEIELNKIEIEKIQISTLSSKDENLDKIYSKEKAIKLRKLKRREESLLVNINKLEKKFKFEIQEARFFLQVFEDLEKVEKVKDYDDYEAQKEYWENKISEEINLRILTKQQLSPELIKTALSLHNESEIRSNMVGILDNCKVQLEMLEAKKESNGRKQIDNK